MQQYTVRDKNGNEVKPGDTVTDRRGDEWVFEGCWHPRKITVQSDFGQREFYPSLRV